MTTRRVEVTRPNAEGEAADGRVYLQQVASSLGLRGNAMLWSWDKILDECADLYWEKRPNITERCGSNPGYRLHELRRETPCQPCRDAHAIVKAIIRRRLALGVHPYPARPALIPCPSHAAFVRHKAHGEDPCTPCEVAEAAYHASHRRNRPAA